MIVEMIEKGRPCHELGQQLPVVESAAPSVSWCRGYPN
jgi:DNA-binding FrmR family transcriptional regulator